jgi:cytochrome c-type biogenesis protein CcmH
MTRAALATALLSLVLAAPALGSESRPTLAEIEHEVMCPTCKTLLELSHAPIADRMRAFIRRRIVAGETKSQIESQLVGEFGEGVLAAPRMHGFGLLAWVLPIAGLLGGAVVVGGVARHWTRSDGGVAPPAPEPVRLDAALERTLDRELARFD